MSSNEVLNILLPYNTFLYDNKEFTSATSLRIVRNYNDNKKEKSDFYIISKDQIIKRVTFLENSIKFNIKESGNEEIVFEDLKRNEQLILIVKHNLSNEHREKFIKSIV